MVKKKTECKEYLLISKEKYKIVNDFRFESLMKQEEIYDRDMTFVNSVLNNIEKIQGFDEVKGTKLASLLSEMKVMLEKPGSTPVTEHKETRATSKEFKDSFLKLYEKLTRAFVDIYGISFLPGG